MLLPKDNVATELSCPPQGAPRAMDTGTAGRKCTRQPQEHPPLHDTLRTPRFQRHFEAFGRERHLPQTCTGRVKDGVAKRCGDERDGCFARAGGWHVGTIEQDTVDTRYGKPKRQAVVRSEGVQLSV